MDVSRRRLLRGGEPVALTPKLFDTLHYLIEHSGTVLSKDELLAAIWPDTVVEENNLGQNISKLRGILGESRGENRYIATAPGRGYRFVASVRAITEESELEAPDAEDSQPTAAPAVAEPARVLPAQGGVGGRRRPVWPLVFVCVLAVAAGVGALYVWRAGRTNATGTPVRTIAVLPFKPLVSESRDEAFELGMADTLISKLSSSGDVTVRPISAVRGFGGMEQDPVLAGKELGVEAVLDGTIQRWGDRIRVTARLIRVGDGKTLWTGQFDENFADIFGVQDSISGRVVAELALRLTGEEQQYLRKRYTADAQAYELYLKGRFFWAKRTREGTEQAVQYFQQALDRDPSYALPYAAIAECYRASSLSEDVPSREALPKAKEAALKALELDERLPEAHTALAYTKFFFDWDLEGAQREYRRALEIDPHYAPAHVGYAHVLSNLGRHEEALREADRALEIDPLSLLAGALKGEFLFHARRYPEAIDQLNKTLEIDPSFWITQLMLGKSYERMGRYQEALDAFRKARDLSGGTSEAISLIGYTYAAAGQPEEAERTLRELKAISEQRYVPAYNIALVYQGLGRADEALASLERAYDERDVHLVFLFVDPKWDTLRGDPRFVDLARRLNLA